MAGKIQKYNHEMIILEYKYYMDVNDRLAYRLPSFRVILSEHSESKDPFFPLNVPKRTDSSTSPPIGGFAQNDISFTVYNAKQQFTVAVVLRPG